jgi:xanthine dehydrogenase accessory factor
VLEGEIQVEELTGRLVAAPAEAVRVARTGVIPVLVSPQLEIGDWRLEIANRQSPISVLIDARMMKRNPDTRMDQAPLVIGLGPGYTAGVDCHAVIETMRGHRLGRVIWQGPAQPNTGTPGMVAGKGAERVVRAPVVGRVAWRLEIGDLVGEGEVMGWVGGEVVIAPFAGVVRGLITPGMEVPAGLKIGDVDARGEVAACFTISDKALAIGGGVLAAILSQASGRANQPSSLFAY